MVSSNYRIIKSSDYISTLWKNGGGTAKQIIVEFADSNQQTKRYLWQAGIADIERDGPFSDFSGYDRTFTLISGNGITLDAGDHGKITVDRCFVPHFFSGDWTIFATLHDGPAQAFNIVCDRSRARATVDIIDAKSLTAKMDQNATVILIHNFAETPLGAKSNEGTTFELLPGDTAIFDQWPQNLIAFTQPDSSSRLALVQIEYH